VVASIEDVARLAGVSIATVSRALRGLPDVASATRNRVMAAAAELDYVASPFAARLASGRTATIGLVVPFVNRWFFSEVIAAVETALRQEGFDLLLYNLGDKAMPPRKRVDGVLVASLVLDEAEFDALLDFNRPVGLLGLEHEGFLSVRIDDVASSRVAVEHLLSLGHRRIALIGGETDDPMAFTPPLKRRDGYRDALVAAGIEPETELDQPGHFTAEGGAAATRRLLDLDQLPTAIFAESDEMAYGALREIGRSGLRVPDDLAVIGFDGQPFSELMGLSTMRQPVSEQALDVTTRLLRLVAGDPDAADGPARVLPTELIVRASTVLPS
jgi:DNA-binding LacI/PurR family transcriptional regulator